MKDAGTEDSWDQYEKTCGPRIVELPSLSVGYIRKYSTARGRHENKQGIVYRINMKKSSSIPEKLKYVRQKATEIRQMADTTADGRFKERMVRPTFVVDAVNEKTLATAERWAASYTGKENYDIVEVPNSPIEAVEIIDLDHRGRGGRAWKVLIQNAYYVDMREDVLLECLINGKGVEDGMLVGPFIWASCGNGLKLTRYNSKDHKVAAVMQQRKDLRVKKSQLEVGGIYETAAGSKSTFLGYVDFDVLNDHGRYANGGNYCGSGAWIPKLELNTVRKMQLWCGGDFEDCTKDQRLYYLDELKSRQMSVKVGQLADTSDILGKIRRAQLQLLSDQLAAIAALPKATSAHQYGALTDEDRESRRLCRLIGSWKHCTYRRPGEPRPDVPELKELFDHPDLKEKL